jgi:hypothetical protein
MNSQVPQKLEFLLVIQPALQNRPWCAILTAPPDTTRLEFHSMQALVAHLEWLSLGCPGLR